MLKKIITFLLCALLFMHLPVNSAETKRVSQVKRVNAIGLKLLKENKLPTRISFRVSQSYKVNAYANIRNEVCVYRGLLDYIDDDDELAAILSHEIGHIINSHVRQQNIVGIAAIAAASLADATANTGSATTLAAETGLRKMSRSKEYEADITGVDLMYKAGYNPLAMISILNKIGGDYVDFLATHPSGNKRLMYIYNYITYNYPDLKYESDSFENFIIYAQPIIDERNSNPEKLAKYNYKQEKLKQKRLIKYAKYTKRR